MSLLGKTRQAVAKKSFLSMVFQSPFTCLALFSLLYFQGMIALRQEATVVAHEDFMDAIMEVQAKKKATLNYYA